MELIKSDFHTRCSDIKILYDHIVLISSERGTVKISSILKASVFIALYNNVEATFYSIFERIHNEVSVIPFSLLEQRFQLKLKYFYFKNCHVGDDECRDLRFPLLKDYLKKSSLFSGNLDTRKGKALFRTYGISFDKNFEKTKLYSLVTIKNKRNKIAHGELSLPDVGKVISHQNLLSIINNANEVLEEFIRSAEVFLSVNKHVQQMD
ncbi:MAE_28990/MAE_18760 family HEPN-like nuclease [Shewanella baltica]|uniref:MAE_28990/MAE_18760 family HEPN-like nuclease n=1 Tax=Shewanella baltica TaxID=62322 RepID=UPI0002185CC5|nr:MAE_28990/MAE_18760 family HEPN-like nuclease [Shewanella baltica]AEH15188.1 hypothetical protein Sbal117_3511 [Shewanella baltica OS117]